MSNNLIPGLNTNPKNFISKYFIWTDYDLFLHRGLLKTTWNNIVCLRNVEIPQGRWGVQNRGKTRGL